MPSHRRARAEGGVLGRRQRDLLASSLLTPGQARLLADPGPLDGNQARGRAGGQLAYLAEKLNLISE
jgi:hypothetical protein